MGKIDDKKSTPATAGVSALHDANPGVAQREPGEHQPNQSQRTHRSFGQLVSDWVHGNRHRHRVEEPVFSSGPSLPTQPEKATTGRLGRRILEKAAAPLVAAEVFRLKQHDKKVEGETEDLFHHTPQGAASATVRAVLPDTPFAAALKTAKSVTKQAVDAAHDIRHRVSVELKLVDSLERLSRLEQLFASTLAPLQEARATLAGLKLSLEESAPPEAKNMMNEAFERADRIVKLELRQTKQLIAEIDRKIASLKTELSRPEFDVVQAHPEIFSPLAQPFEYQQASQLLMERRRHCAGRALECANGIKSAPDVAQQTQFLADYMAFVAAAEDMQRQLKKLMRKSFDPALTERVQLSEQAIKGTLHSAKVAAAGHAHLARSIPASGAAVGLSTSGGDG
ncbi:MAG: hypothetical protein V4636_19445 [Pseudomonadota bacterium]